MIYHGFQHKVRWIAVVNVTYTVVFVARTTVLRHVFHCKRYPYVTVYDTTSYDRNTAEANRVIYGPFTIVIISFAAVYGIVNACV